MTNKYIYSLLLSLFSFNLFALELNIETAAGNITYQKNENNSQCEFLLNNAPAIQFDCEFSYPPEVIGNFKGNFGDITQLVIIQESPMGNACDGGPLHLLGIRSNNTLMAEETIDFCGGKSPVVAHTKTTVTIVFPGGPPNRGEGVIPTVTWKYEDGELYEVK